MNSLLKAHGRQSVIKVPEEVAAIANDQLGAFFERLSGIDRRVLAADFLDASKPVRHADILQRYVDLQGKKLLEIGVGFGTNLADWIKRYDVDGYGVEPASAGFDSTFRGARLLFSANGLDPDRVVNATGEALPFEDESFDVVYSSNVLEHTEDPERVLLQALRVLRPGGTLHMEMPNFLSYFEGHYMIVQPPIVWNWLLPAWVRLRGRDPAFARTLNTRINPPWCRRAVRVMRQRHDVTLLSLGEDLFLDRLSSDFHFETAAVAAKLRFLLASIRALNIGNWIGHLVVGLRGHYPIYLTVRRN